MSSPRHRRWSLATLLTALIGAFILVTPLAALAQSLSVSPDGQAATEPLSSGPIRLNFGVSGTQANTQYYIELICDGTYVTNCSTSLGQSHYGIFGSVPVDIWTGATAGTGRVRVKVYKSGYTPSDTGWFNVSVHELTPPTISLMQPASGSTTQQYPTIQVGWCDNTSLNSGTRWITVNGTNVTSSFDYNTSNGPSGCGASASSTTTSVALNLGSNTVQAYICDNWNNCTTSNAWTITRTDVTAPTISLTSPSTVFTQYPQIQIKWCDNESLNSGSRSIKVNTVDLTSSFDYVTGGTGCNVVATSTTSTVSLNLGANTVQANICDNWSNCTPQSFTITREPPPGVTLANHNRDNHNRPYCLTLAAGDGAEVNCGDLIAYHVMPTFKTMNIARNLKLVYNSAAAEPRPRVAANVSPGGGDVPQNVFAKLVMSGATQDSATFSTASWPSTDTRQLVLAFDASGKPSGVYPFSFVVRFNYSGGFNELTVNDTLLLVNRETSEFGAGWYLSGVESLVLSQPGNTILWIGGDGSAKMYDSVAVGQWLAPAGGYRDSIVRVASTYERRGQHGVKITFDASGRHTQTRNRLGHVTNFTWTSNRLTSITLPPASSSYQLAYDPNNLDKITDPAGRVLEATVSGGLLTTLTDPDNKSVSFGYDGQKRLTSRTNRLSAVNHYYYDNDLRVTRIQVQLDTFAHLATTSITNWDELGLALNNPAGVVTPADWAKVRTLVDGARPPSDVADTTAFYVNRFGQPIKIVNAVGSATLINRDDARWPALPTVVQTADGFVAQATYDGRGNLATETQVNALGDGHNAVRYYYWNTKWDFPDSTISATGVRTSFGYDPNNGNRLWQQHGSDAARLVNFHYGNSLGLLSATLLPQTLQDSVEYDGNGNVSETKTPRGFWTSHYNDATGLDTLVVTPIDSTDKVRGGAADSTGRLRQRTVFSVMGRDLLSESIAPNRTQTLRVNKYYNAEGDIDSLSRQSLPDSANIGIVTTRWQYDLAHRAVTEVAPDNRVQTTAYDEVGNVKTVNTRRGFALQMTYDTLNRLSTRTTQGVTYHDTTAGIGSRDQQAFPRYPNSGTDYVIAAQTDTFRYDVLGRVLTANNSDAHVSRTYYPNGLLKSDEQQLRNATGQTFSHDYLVRFSYNYDGEKTAVKLPSALVPAGTNDSIARVFSSTTGDLIMTIDALANQYWFDYTPRAELAKITYPWPSSYYEQFAYNPDGDVVGDTIVNTGGVGAGRLPSPGRAMKLVYDGRGKVVRLADATGFQETDSSQYSGLGQLIMNSTRQYGELSGYQITDTYVTHEQPSYDALGNIYSAVTSDTIWLNGALYDNSTRNRSATFQSGVGRLLSESDNKIFRYDADGNLEFSMKDVSGTAPLEDRFTYYGADARIRAADYRYVSSGQGFLSPEKWVFEEYRYDALGRRVWVRAYRNCAGFSGPSLSTSEYLQCSTSTLRRTIWNGEEELIEIQVPGDTLQTQQTLEGDDQQWRLPRDSYNNDPNPLFGRVVYTSGLQLDQPIAVTRYRYTDYFTGTTYTDFPPTTYSLYWSPIGRMALATCVDGKTNCAGGSTYMRFEYPQALFAYDRQKFFPFEFQGTLILDKEDGVRTFYRRGRVYDPASGRFTQEDPIGLAGGLNLYGFVSGDPVNLSDPFGLCPLSKTICQWWARYRAELADQDRRLQQACAHDPNMCVQEVDMGPFDASPAGVEEEVLSIASKFDNIMKELKSFNHFSTARLEKTGRLITGFQHGKELEYFANGLKNSAIRLKRMLGDARLSAEARVEIQALLSKVSRLRDQILETLR